MRRVVAVVVTWNRLPMLRECLDAVLTQTHAPERVVVVDCASADGTHEWLAEAFADDDRVVVITMRTNVGGAGGFATGIMEALRESPDAVWVLDDDALPTPTAVEELVRVWEDYPGVRPSVVASRVLWTDGRDQPANTPRPRRGTSRLEMERAAAAHAVPIRTASFVSALLDGHSVRTWGLPIADYFLWNDDFEYTARLLRSGVGLYCPGSVVIHRTAAFSDDAADPGERFYFEVRNKLWVLARSRSLRWGERLLFAGATVMRWIRVWRASSARGTLWSHGWRGVRDSLHGPRSNAEVLRDARLTTPPSEGAPFSLLMSTWAPDDPERLRAAIVSATVQQTRCPDELVLVQDGPVPDELAEVIADAEVISGVRVRHVVLEQNFGLGPALQAGLAACSHEIVARMDADDVSLPHRFDAQVPEVEQGADLVGAWLLEYGASPEQIVGQRKQPTSPKRIRRVMRFRDPFNHPTVIYRKSAVMAAGGYSNLRLMEDYLLFARMVNDGAVPANVGEPLLLYRAGSGTYARRGGLELLRSEIRLQLRFRQLGITSRSDFVRNVVLRGGYRLAPRPLRRVAYRRVFRSADAPPAPSVDSPHAS